ncbi:MAG: cell division protein FtsZ [Hyphomicrobiaceae bacterium]
MSINLELPKLMELTPRIVVVGVGGAGGNAINNMIESGLTGVEYVAANTDAQALLASSAERQIQLGVNLTEGLGAGSKAEIGEAAAEEAIDEIRTHIGNAHMVFIAAGMGGGTGTGAASVIARVAREMGILTVGIVTKPFQFEGTRRQRTAEAGIAELRKFVDTLIVIPNQNLFRIATEKTTFAEAFLLADKVLYSGVACIVDLIVKDGLINLDFADVRTIMSGMGAAMMGTGEASGERRAMRAAEEAIANPLLDEMSLKGARGVLLSIIGGHDMTLFEVDEAASRVREEVDPDANIIVGATFDDDMGDRIRVAIVASGMGGNAETAVPRPAQQAVPPGGDATKAREPAMAPPLPPVGRPQAGAQAEHVAGWPPPVAPPFGGQPSQPVRPAATTENRPPLPPQGNGQGSASNELWRAPGNVVIEQAPVRRPPPARTAQESSADSSVSNFEPFTPAPPHDLRRQPSSRVPPIDEFPAVGQREYHAKAGRYDQPPASPQHRRDSLDRPSLAHQQRPNRPAPPLDHDEYPERLVAGLSARVGKFLNRNR